MMRCISMLVLNHRKRGAAKTVVATSFAALSTLLACAAETSADNSSFAIQMGYVLGSEKICGLTYDKTAVAAYIDYSTTPGDKEFPRLLKQMTLSVEKSMEKLSVSEQRELCRKTHNMARKLKFVR